MTKHKLIELILIMRPQFDVPSLKQQSVAELEQFLEQLIRHDNRYGVMTHSDHIVSALIDLVDEYKDDMNNWFMEKRRQNLDLFKEDQ